MRPSFLLSLLSRVPLPPWLLMLFLSQRQGSRNLNQFFHAHKTACNVFSFSHDDTFMSSRRVLSPVREARQLFECCPRAVPRATSLYFLRTIRVFSGRETEDAVSLLTRHWQQTPRQRGFEEDARDLLRHCCHRRGRCIAPGEPERWGAHGLRGGRLREHTPGVR